MSRTAFPNPSRRSWYEVSRPHGRAVVLDLVVPASLAGMMAGLAAALLIGGGMRYLAGGDFLSVYLVAAMAFVITALMAAYHTAKHLHLPG